MKQLIIRIRAIVFLNMLVLIIGMLSLSLDLNGQNQNDYLKSHFGKLNKSQIVDSLLNLSQNYVEDNPDTAIFMAGIALDLAKTSKNAETVALANRRIAEGHFYKNDFQEAIDFYLEAANAEFRQKKDSTYFYGECLSEIAYCYQELGIYDKSLELFKGALSIFNRLGNNEDISNMLSNIGTNYYFRSQFDKAIEYYEESLKMDRQRSDSSAIAISMNNIGMVYSRWGKHLKALEFYNEALNYTSSEARKAIRLSNVGMSWYHLKDYDKALEFLNKALAIDTKYHQDIKVGIRKNEIATVLSAIGKYEEAISLNNEALAIFREKEVRDSQIITLSELGDIYRKKGMIKEAEACFLESSQIAKENNSLHHLSRNYRNLCEIAEEKSDYKTALEYFRLYSQVHDSVFNIEKHKQIARFEILYEIAKKEKENQVLIHDNELKQKRQRLAVAFIAGLLLAIVLISRLYKIKAKNLKQSQLLLKQEHELTRMEIDKKEVENRVLEDRVFAEKQINRLQAEKYQAEIDHKNAELAGSTICLVSKNEILGEIREKLKSKHKDETIHEVVQFINANTDIDQDWHKFKVTFENVHPGFFDRLHNNFPQLTENDIRTSAYLRISLSSREIAGLMNVTLDATNKSRQRLRKKLDLKPEADLTDFLKSI